MLSLSVNARVSTKVEKATKDIEHKMIAAIIQHFHHTQELDRIVAILILSGRRHQHVRARHTCPFIQQPSNGPNRRNGPALIARHASPRTKHLKTFHSYLCYS